MLKNQSIRPPKQQRPDRVRQGNNLSRTKVERQRSTFTMDCGALHHFHHQLGSWLFTTLYRRLLGQRRHTTRFPEMQVESIEWELPAIDAGLDDRLDADAVVRALQTLDEKYRAPLALFYLQEHSYREIAAVLGLPIGTIIVEALSRQGNSSKTARRRQTRRLHQPMRKSGQRTRAKPCCKSPHSRNFSTALSMAGRQKP